MYARVARQLREHAAEGAKRARTQILLTAPLIVAVVLAYSHRRGTVAFLIRLVTLIMCVTVALRLAGLRPETLAVGGAITAVILGLAAQQTIGNLIAGTVLMSARPFRVTLANGEDRILVPNNVVLSGAVVPLREPTGVDVRARLSSEVKPSQVEQRLEEEISVPTRTDPQIDLEEIVDGELVVRITATPVKREDGAALADQVVTALEEVHTAQQAG